MLTFGVVRLGGITVHDEISQLFYVFSGRLCTRTWLFPVSRLVLSVNPFRLARNCQICIFHWPFIEKNLCLVVLKVGVKCDQVLGLLTVLYHFEIFLYIIKKEILKPRLCYHIRIEPTYMIALHYWESFGSSSYFFWESSCSGL